MTVHNALSGRSAANAHPIDAITGLEAALSGTSAAVPIAVDPPHAVVTEEPNFFTGSGVIRRVDVSAAEFNSTGQVALAFGVEGEDYPRVVWDGGWFYFGYGTNDPYNNGSGYIGAYDEDHLRIQGGVVADGGDFRLNALPTADPAENGQLWNDGGTLKISAG